MAKKSTSEIAVTNPQLQKSLAIIEGLKSQVDTIGNQLILIKVVDDSTLAICQQNLSKANSVVKTIEDKRVELTAPFLEGQRAINALCKSITELATKGIAHAKLEVGNWERARLAKEAEKQAEIDAKAKIEAGKIEAENARKKSITDFIHGNLVPYLQGTYEGLKTEAQCKDFLNYIETKFPGKEKFQEYLEEAEVIKQNYINLINNKIGQLKSAESNNAEEMAILKRKEKLAIMQQELDAEKLRTKQLEDALKAENERKETEALAEQTKAELEAKSQLDKTRGIRSLWKFEVVDEERIPKEWMILDESIVKLYIKEHKDALVDGYIINGIKFIKEISVVA